MLGKVRAIQKNISYKYNIFNKLHFNRWACILAGWQVIFK